MVENLKESSCIKVPDSPQEMISHNSEPNVKPRVDCEGFFSYLPHLARYACFVSTWSHMFRFSNKLFGCLTIVTTIS